MANGSKQRLFPRFLPPTFPRATTCSQCRATVRAPTFVSCPNGPRCCPMFMLSAWAPSRPLFPRPRPRAYMPMLCANRWTFVYGRFRICASIALTRLSVHPRCPRRLPNPTPPTPHTHQPSLYVVLQSMSKGVASAYALQVVVQRAWQARGTQRGAIGHEEQREATTGGWHNPKLWKRCVGAMGARRCNGVARAGGRPW